LVLASKNLAGSMGKVKLKTVAASVAATIARVARENYQKRRDHGQGIAVVQSWLKLARREDLNVLPDRFSGKKTTNL
jgi:hypothetical protein